MINTRLFRLVRDKRLSVPVLRYFHDEFTKPELKRETDKKQEKLTSDYETEQTVLTGAMRHKFKEFREEESPEILDVVEERERYQTQDEPDDLYSDAYLGLNLKSTYFGIGYSFLFLILFVLLQEVYMVSLMWRT